MYNIIINTLLIIYILKLKIDYNKLKINYNRLEIDNNELKTDIDELNIVCKILQTKINNKSDIYKIY